MVVVAAVVEVADAGERKAGVEPVERFADAGAQVEIISARVGFGIGRLRQTLHFADLCSGAAAAERGIEKAVIVFELAGRVASAIVLIS